MDAEGDRFHSGNSRLRDEAWAWRAYALLGLALVAGYYGLGGAAQPLIYDVIGLSALAAVLVGIRRHRPAVALPWWLLAAGIASLVAGDIALAIYEQVLGVGVPFPSVADALYLSGFPLLGAALLRLCRARHVGRGDRIDAAILGTGYGIAAWIFFLAPYLKDPAYPWFERLVSAAYPGMDIVLVACAALLVLGPGARPTSFLLLTGGMALTVAADVLYAQALLAGTYATGGPLDAAWLLGYVAWGAAALHPAMNAVGRPNPASRPRLTTARLALLAAAALTGPGMLFVESRHDHAVDVPVVAGATALIFLLVLLRLRDLMGAIERNERRFRALVQHGADVTAILDSAAAIRYLSPSVERVVGHPPAELVGDSVLAWVHPEDVPPVARLLTSLENSPAEPRYGEVRIRRRDGTFGTFEAVVVNLLQDPDVGGIVVNARDVTDRKAAEDRLAHQATHDPLTDLPNRTLFQDRLRHALARTGDRPERVAILFLDLDDFKLVNDTLGHEAGDQLLIEVAARLRGCVRAGDTVARLGGDEFAILLEDLADADGARGVAEAVAGALRSSVRLAGREVFPTFSVGIAVTQSAQEQADDLLRAADVAMYDAKQKGKARHALFDPAMEARAWARLRLEEELRRAIVEGELVLFYQPLVELVDGRIAEVEALVRWRHPTRGLVMPDEFIPVAEESGLITLLGRWVLGEACRQVRTWQVADPALAGLRVAVNLSARELGNPGLAHDVSRVLRESGLAPDCLTLEITESTAMVDVEGTVAMMRALKRCGVRLAIDDFGAGYSGLSYLRRCPVDALKIDKSYVAGLGREPEDAAMVRATLGFAQTLGMVVTAEGIDAEVQLAELRALGCARGQGYLFARPQPAAAVAALLGVPAPEADPASPCLAAIA